MTEPASPAPEVDPNDFSELEAAEGEAARPTELPPPAAKISAADSSLQVVSSGRRLRKRAIALTISAGVAVAAGSLLIAGKGEATVQRTHEEAAVTAPVPQSLLDAPERLERKSEVEMPAPAPPPPLPSVPTHSQAASDPASAARAARRSKDEQDFWKARTAGILVDTGLPAAPAKPPPAQPGEPEDDHSVRAAQPSDGAAPGHGDVFGDDPNMQARKNRFLSGELAPTADQRLTRIQHPRSPFELKPGTIIPAALESAISSDLPGPVIARVTENVCDSVHGDWLLVPQGATLIAYYDSMVAWGQERVLMCWKQLELPNGDSMPLGCMPAADWAGQAGLNDQVDEHWWRIVKGAAVSSLLAAATTAAAGNTVGFNPTLPQLAARGAATQIGSVGESITRRNIMIQPTLTIRQAQPVNVIITQTLDFSSDAPATPCHSRQGE